MAQETNSPDLKHMRGSAVTLKISNSNRNKLLDEDRVAHDWYRFVLSYPPHLIRDYISRFNIGSEHRVLDPFCGTGTTIVECKRMAIPSVGIEAHPMACFASRVKTRWGIDPDGLLEHAGRVARAARKDFQESGIVDDASLPLFHGNQSAMLPELRKLPEESQKLLLAGSINPLQLHKVLVLLGLLNHEQDCPYREHELLALAKALVNSISNLHFGPEVGVRVKKHDAPVVSSWLSAVSQMCDDLRELQHKNETEARIHCHDSRDIVQVIRPNSIDAVITSPPYPNEKDYTRTTRLESVLLGFIQTKAELRRFKKTLMRSNTRNVYKDDADDRWISSFPEIDRIAQRIEERRIALGKTSGFEKTYPKVVKLYFGGMARHLSDLRTVLRPGARLAYVVGDQASYLRVMIRTGKLLAGIAESLGYELLGIDLFRTRLATATKEQLREEAVILRWPGNQR